MKIGNRQSIKNALLISLLYLIFGILWIYFSDMSIELFTNNAHQLSIWQTYKGVFFIAVTAVLLYLLSYRILQERFVEYMQRLDEQKAAQILLAQQDTLLRTIVNSSPDAIFVKDLEGKYLLFNNGASNIVGISPEKVIGNTDALLFSPEAVTRLQEQDRAIISGREIVNQEERLTTTDGKEKNFWVTKGPLFTEEGNVSGLFGISRDITAIMQNEKAIIEAKEHFDYLAHHDPLTNLPNRLSLIEILNLKTSPSESRPFALLFLDLDGFKEINDSYGHPFGDQILIQFTQLLQKNFPQDTVIARTGGDEFVIILLCRDNNQEFIITSMRKLIEKLNLPFKINDTEVYITASIGVAVYPDNSDNAEELFQHADAAMYNAKKMGKNTFSFYNSRFTEEALHRTTMATNLKKALHNEDLSLYFQPQIDMASGNVVGTEVLLRWFSSNGTIPPSIFIPIAEEMGLILDVGRFVLREGCNAAAQWAKEGILQGRIAINVSARQLIHPNFLTVLEDIIDETQCNPAWIELEITESSILENPKKTIALLGLIKEKGFNISIDDFGTGYSSLSYLKNLPIDKLKIDLSFIRDITNHPKNQTIVTIIIGLAKGLNMSVLAEGVETLEELEFLRFSGIDSIQGYYYHKPMPIEEMTALLKKS